MSWGKFWSSSVCECLKTNGNECCSVCNQPIACSLFRPTPTNEPAASHSKAFSYWPFFQCNTSPGVVHELWRNRTSACKGWSHSLHLVCTQTTSLFLYVCVCLPQVWRGGRGGLFACRKDKKMKESVKVCVTVPGYQVYCLEELRHD